jgi:hypothetical protein
VAETADGAADEGQGQRFVSHLEFSGVAHNVLQAHTISGGVHYHHEEPATVTPTPRQLPGDVKGFINRLAALGRLDAMSSGGVKKSRAAPTIMIVGTARAFA